MMIRMDHHEVVQALLDAMAGGRVPWRRPWMVLPPRNGLSGRRYSGYNRINLSMAPFRDHRWVTPHQVQVSGGTLLPGAEPYYVTAWVWTAYPVPGSSQPNWRLAGYGARVFNVEQTAGLPVRPLEWFHRRRHEPIEAAEAVVKGYEDGPPIDYGGQVACYKPAEDRILMPAPSSFEASGRFYSTLFHEMAHSTGHPARLDRKRDSDAWAPFGSEDYSREELTAEFAAAFLCEATGLVQDDLRDQSTAYLQSWWARIDRDRAMAITSAQRAQHAADYILGTYRPENLRRRRNSLFPQPAEPPADPPAD